MFLRRFRDCLTILGLALIVALAGVWIASINTKIVVSWRGPWSWHVRDGALIAHAFFCTRTTPLPKRGEHHRTGLERIPVPQPTGRECLVPGHATVEYTSPLFGSTDRIDIVIIPLWLPIALLLVATAAPICRLSARIRRQVRALRTPAGYCTECGYNLTGNESGKCPECGTPLNKQPVAPAIGVPYDGTIEEQE
jgi:hypothetical protein